MFRSSLRLHCRQFVRHIGDDVQMRLPEKSLNRVTLIGRAGSDAQLRGSDERPVTIISMATNQSWQKMDGTVGVRTDWHRIAVFKPGLRDRLAAQVKSGDRLYVEGQLTYTQIGEGEQSVKLTSIIADNIINLTKKGVSQETDTIEVPT